LEHTSTMKKKTVVISIHGGVADIESLPDGIKVIIRDYDIDGADDESLVTRIDGEDCIVSEYENKKFEVGHRLITGFAV
jgi:hypothetical protein